MSMYKDLSKYVFFYGGIHSQWHIQPFKNSDGLEFNCAEQFMMYNKAKLFNDDLHADLIMKTLIPSDQKSLGKKVKNFDKKVWDSVARDIVYEGNYYKYTQNPNLKKMLLNTGNALLVEASNVDVVWGIGLGTRDEKRWNPENWRGTNWLGQVLTRLRDNLRKEEKLEKQMWE